MGTPGQLIHSSGLRPVTIGGGSISAAGIRLAVAVAVADHVGIGFRVGVGGTSVADGGSDGTLAIGTAGIVPQAMKMTMNRVVVKRLVLILIWRSRIPTNYLHLLRHGMFARSGRN